MNEHERINELLPLYAAGQLEAAQRRDVAAHLAGCAECQADLALWQAVSLEVRAESGAARPPARLAESVLARAARPARPRFSLGWAGQLLRAQARLVQKELWPVSAAVIGMGFFLALDVQNVSVLHALAPLAAAAGVASLARPEDQAALELALSTPTSLRQILLARLALVFSYDLLLALAASLGLSPFFPALPLAQMIVGWLAPMAFLSMLALALSLVIGHDNAILVSYAVWFVQYLPGWTNEMQAHSLPGALSAAFTWYAWAWTQPGVLFGMAALAFGAALALAGGQAGRLPRVAES